MNTRSRRLALLLFALLLLPLLALFAGRSYFGSSVSQSFSRIGSGLALPEAAATPAAEWNVRGMVAAEATSTTASAGADAPDGLRNESITESGTMHYGTADGSTPSEALPTPPPAAVEVPPAIASGGAVAVPATGGPAAQNSMENSVAPTPVPVPGQSLLTAGKVDDNADFNDYLGYLGAYSGFPMHSIDVARRLFVRVLDANQHPVAGARVQLYDGQRQVFDAETVSDGRVLFFPNAAGATQAQSLQAVVSRGQTTYPARSISLNQQSSRADVDIALDKATEANGGQSDPNSPVGVDLVFLVDATGSMGDEIDKIKASVGTIASRIEQLPGSSRPRLGLVAYRDRGDEYVTRSWDFTDTIPQFSANLAQVVAAGGGDEPESVSAGLHDAIHLPGWADNSAGKHLRMIVLVGDAPPHLDYPNDYEYTSLLNEAVAAGIKVFPIGASGLGDQGEYIFRQFAEVTQGQFVFLTYANGVAGAPGVATTNHVSNFTVKDLDSLVVSLVAGEVANQAGQAAQGSVPVTSAPAASTHHSLGDTVALVGLVVLEAVAGQAWSALNHGWNNILVPALLILMGLLMWSGRQVRKARVALKLPQALLPQETEEDIISDYEEPEQDILQPVSATGWFSPPTSQPAWHMTLEPSRTAQEIEGQRTLPLGTLPPEIAALLQHQ